MAPDGAVSRRPPLARLVAEARRRRGSRTDSGAARFDKIADAFQGWVERSADVDGIEEEEIVAWARRRRIPYLGAGAERVVFAVPEGALKVAFDRDRMSSNLNEARVWEEAPNRIRRHLVPVLDVAADGRWLLMERVSTRASGQARHSLNELDFSALYACGLADIRDANIADDGRVLDYGFLYDRPAWDRCADEDG